MSKKMTHRKLRTNKQLCAMPRDNLDAGDFWILCGEDYVVLTAQKLGNPSTGSITIPKRLFNRMVDFYNGGSPQ